jgi:NitT/TauT family transport system ATP-binding protein
MSVDGKSVTADWVQLNHVNKVYSNGTIALQDVSLHIRENEFISFVGPSGCGKSTVFKLIAGLTEPTDGDIRIMGMTPSNARKQSEMAFVFQDHTLLPWCSVEENVMLPLSLRGMPKKQRREEAARVLELVGLKDYKKALPRMLSGGMKMRVSIARALASRPKLLLMDEPFGALDEITRQTLQQELLDIWQREQGMTVLFVTHNVFEAVFLSTRVMVMTPRPGKISEEISIPFAFPRDESYHTTSEFSEYVRKVSAALKH